MNFFYYIILSSVYSFLILCIVFREFPLHVFFRVFLLFVHIKRYLYTGKRAVFLSLGLLFLITIVLFTKIDNGDILFFDSTIFLKSFLLGVPIAFITHRMLSQWFRYLASEEDEQGVNEDDKDSIIVGKISPRRVTVGRFILWVIPGLLAGVIFSMPLYFLSKSILLAGTVEVLIAFFVAWLGARAHWI